MRVVARSLLAGIVVACLLAVAFGFGWLPGQSSERAVKVAPVLAAQSDGWHVDAALPGITRFTFVIRIANSADVYVYDVASPFTIDPLKFGGRSVSISARASGRKTNPWATAVKVNVPPAKPVMTVAADRTHVDAHLPGTKTFTFVVKTTGLPDTQVIGVAPPFVIDRARFGGRSISVSAQASGSKSYPWAQEQTIDVPQLKLFGISNPTGPKGASAEDAKQLGVSLIRIELSYGDDIAAMDAKISANTSRGVMPLVLLSQTSTTVPGAVLPISKFDVDGWKAWASVVVARYGTGGTFWKGRADSRYAPTHFEVLNEPYGWWFFTPPEPAAYATFFVDVVGAARKANPKAKFLLAGSPNIYAIGTNQYSQQSWDNLLKNSPDGPAAQQLADGVTVHPYGSFQNDHGWRSTVTTHYDFPQLPVWITEVGYRLNEVNDGVTVTRDTQAQLMQRSLVDYMTWPWAQAYVWFTWFDYNDTKTGDPNWFGIVEPDGTHRPAYDTYRRFIISNTSES